MVTPRRLQRPPLGKLKGWRLPPGAKLVTRPSRWGNPYKVKPHGPHEQAEAVELFRAYLLDHPELVEQARSVLAGFDLACSCNLDEPCHADVWLEVLNSAGRDPKDLT